jgi:hypothetical protein
MSFSNTVKELLGIRLSTKTADRYFDSIRDDVCQLSTYDGNNFDEFKTSVFQYGEQLLEIQKKMSILDHNKDCEGYIAIVRAISLRQTVYYKNMSYVRKYTLPGRKYVPVDIEVKFDVELKEENKTFSQYVGSVKLLSDTDLLDELLLEQLFLNRKQDNTSILVAGSFVDDHPEQSVYWDKTDGFFDIAVCHCGDLVFYVPGDVSVTFHDNGCVVSDCNQFFHHDGTFEVYEGMEHVMLGSRDSFEILGFMHNMHIESEQNPVKLPAGTFHEVNNGMIFNRVSSNSYEITYF